MATIFTLLSVVPFWDESMDVTRFYAAGWGNAVYWGKHVMYMDIDEAHGGSMNMWDASGATWGAMGGFRRNQWGVEFSYEQVSLRYWHNDDDVVTDRSTKTVFDLAIKRFFNASTHTYVGFDIRSQKFTGQTIATQQTYYNINNEVNGTCFALSGKYFLENDRFNRPNRGLLPWVGGDFGFYSSSYSDDNDVASDALTPEIGLNIGLMVKPWSWLDFWGMGGVSLLESQYDIGDNTNADPRYEYVRHSNTLGYFRLGMTLTYTRGYVLE